MEIIRTDYSQPIQYKQSHQFARQKKKRIVYGK